MKPLNISVLLLITLMTGSVVEAQKPKTEVEFGKWQYLYRSNPKAVGTKQLPKNSPLKPTEDFHITGANTKSANRLNRIVCDGKWAITQGALKQVSGRSAALNLGEMENFELELGVQAEGTGGWFFVFGDNEGHGYCLYNVTMRSSGSPWFLTEYRNNKGILETDREVDQYPCRGKEAVLIRVIDKSISVTVGKRKILDSVELSSYQKGNLILGTYDTQYGPKPIKIFGIRLRTTK